VLYDPSQKELAALLARMRREIRAKIKGKRVFALLQIVLAVSVPLFSRLLDYTHAK
jgi:hypothetical protein